MLFVEMPTGPHLQRLAMLLSHRRSRGGSRACPLHRDDGDTNYVNNWIKPRCVRREMVKQRRKGPGARGRDGTSDYTTSQTFPGRNRPWQEGWTNVKMGAPSHLVLNNNLRHPTADWLLFIICIHHSTSDQKY